MERITATTLPVAVDDPDVVKCCMAEPLDARERRELCDLLIELGPDAPTLCEGWTTLDLTAHLVLREHFSKWGDEKLAAEKTKGLPALVTRLRDGAPVLPWRVPGLRTVLNGGEYLIHHEDVRRANGRGPRTDRPDLDASSWRMIGFLGRRVARQLRPHGFTLARPNGSDKHYGPAGGAVLTARPTELLLYLAGRRAAADVVVSGDAAAIAALTAARTGL